jgi:hypothetical protein
LERGARQIGADHDAIRTGKIQAHLAGSAANVNDPSVSGNRFVQKPRKRTPFCAHVQRVEAVAWRIPGEGIALIKHSHRFGAEIAGKAKPGNAVRCLKYRTARGAREFCGKPLRALRTGEQFSEALHLQKIA